LFLNCNVITFYFFPYNQVAAVTEIKAEDTKFELSTVAPHGDASVSGTSVVLDHAASPNKAAVTRSIVFVTSEVCHLHVGADLEVKEFPFMV
jgi:hypothetical protein